MNSALRQLSPITQGALNAKYTRVEWQHITIIISHVQACLFLLVDSSR